MGTPQNICSGSEDSFDIEAQQVTPFSLCVVSEAGTGNVHGQTLDQAPCPPYSDNFYQYPWFRCFVILLLTSIIANFTIILQYSSSVESMEYFVGGGLTALGWLFVYFHLPPILIYPLLFIRSEKSTSAAEWLVQKMCTGKSMQVQTIALKVVSVVLLLLGQVVTLMPFYYPNMSLFGF
jgi:hypothetical protein